MGNTKSLSIAKNVLYTTLISLLGILAIVFAVLYIETFNDGFFKEYSTIVTAVSVSIITIITVLTITFLRCSKKIIYKLFFLLIITLSIILASMYLLKSTGFLERVDSVEDFREYISSFGNYAVVLFIIIQFLQVVVLPIPSFITVGAGVLLFGALKGSIFSCIGIIIGSITAFVLGRFFGFKLAKWLVGEKNLKKGIESIKGKDKLILTFMFLFPFFPDDVLCFVAGITSISSAYFIIMIIIVRIITVFVSSYSMNNSIIPYDTWWGILLWLVFFALTIVATIIIYKYGEKIEKLIFKKRENQGKH